MMKLFAKRLLLSNGWRENQVVTVENGLIVSIESGTHGDLFCELLTPGLMDIHAHGGEGYYTADLNEEALTTYLEALPKHGITDVVLTTGSFADYNAVLQLFQSVIHRQQQGLSKGAWVQGVHLEGPFLNPDKSGAMNPDLMTAASPEAFDRLFGPYKDMIRLVTIAPEMPGVTALIPWLRSQGFRVQLGHTSATYDQAQSAFEFGADSLCHTFNACRGIHHREPGVVTAALMNPDIYCEAICDLKHLHPAIVNLIYRLKGYERMIVVSDTGATAGLPDGDYTFGGKAYHVVDGTNRVKGGETLSGGACYIDRSVANLIDIGIASDEAFRMATEIPARYLNLPTLGSIRPGAQAHLAAWNQAGECAFSLIVDQLIAY